jgi:hypothetical protein
MDITASFDRYGRKDRQYYFAYGSNMHPAQISTRCAAPRAVCTACLADHKLAFHGRNRVWDGGMATVVPAQGREVWGVLYELGFGGAYFHYPVLVRDGAGEEHAAVLYKKDVLGTPVPPSSEHMAFILEAARMRSLPPRYLQILEKMESTPARYDVPREAKQLHGVLVEATCHECAG